MAYTPSESILGPAASYTSGGRDETVLQALSDVGGCGTAESLAHAVGWGGGGPGVITSLQVCFAEGYVNALDGGLWKITTAGENALTA